MRGNGLGGVYHAGNVWRNGYGCEWVVLAGWGRGKMLGTEVIGGMGLRQVTIFHHDLRAYQATVG